MLTYRQMKIACNNRAFVFSNNATGGGDTSTDPGAENNDPNSYLAPVIGGGKIFNTIFLTLVCIALVIFIVAQTKNILK